RDASGRLWFPTIAGVATVDPAHLVANVVAPRVSITQVLVDGRSVAGTDLVVPPGTRNVEVDFVAPSFLQPDRVRYRYRMDGLDPEWVDLGSGRVAYFSRLPPGRYALHVVAANEDG